MSAAGIILGTGSANERRRYYVTPPLIGQAHTQNDPCAGCTVAGSLSRLCPSSYPSCSVVNHNHQSQSSKITQHGLLPNNTNALTHWGPVRQMSWQICVIIGLPTVWCHCQLNPWEQISVKFKSKYHYNLMASIHFDVEYMIFQGIRSYIMSTH